MRREFITENKVINADSNISLNNIYKAITDIQPEQQGIILGNYTFMELYNIFANNDGYEKYINDLFAASREYTNRAIALSALHTQAFLRSLQKMEKFDPAIELCKLFDCMSKEDQKRFCEGMFQKKEFFEDAYRNMMDVFENAEEREKENSNIVESDGDVEGDKHVESNQ